MFILNRIQKEYLNQKLYKVLTQKLKHATLNKVQNHQVIKYLIN